MKSPLSIVKKSNSIKKIILSNKALSETGEQTKLN